MSVTCRKVSCCNSESGEQFSDFLYSLVNGQTYTNLETTFIIPCPIGYDCTADSVTITLPPGTVRFTPVDLNPNPPPGGNPHNPAAGTYTFNCGTDTLNITTDGTGFTQGQIDQIIAFLTECQANQDGNAELQPVPVLTPSGKPGLRLWNTEQTCTAECPLGETGTPVTITIPAHTYSAIVAQSATPLAKYLAQQQLDTDTYDAACEQAQVALVCNPAAVCPELKSTFDAGAGNGIHACQYGLTQDYVYATGDLGGDMTVKAFDNADVQQLTAAFPGFSVTQLGLCYSVIQNRLYVACLDTGVFEGRLKVLSAIDLSEVTEIDTNPILSGGGLPRYVAALDLVVVSGTSGILLVDCSTDAISQSDVSGNLDSCSPAYADSSSRFYCLTQPTASCELVVRNLTLAPVGSIALTGFSLNTNVGPGAVYTTGGKIITAARNNGTLLLTIFVVDPQTDTVTNTVVSGVNDDYTSIDYDPSLNLVYLTSGIAIVVFNPVTETIICEIAQFFPFNGPKQAGVNTTTDRFYVPVPNAAGTINKYGQP